MPRDRTLARENGSKLPTAWTLPSSSLNMATCSPSTSAATPESGMMSSSRQTRVAISSCGFKVSLPLLGPRRPDLSAFGDKHHVAVGRVAVHEMAEALEDLRRLDRSLPLAGIIVDKSLHLGLELGADTQRVLAHGPAHVVDAAFEILQPHAGALQP